MLRTRRTGFDDPAAREALALLDRLLPGARAGTDADPDATLIVASRAHPQGERSVGCVGVIAIGEGVGRLIGPVVDPQMQQQGIGRRLLAEGEREALGNRRLRRLHCPAERRHAEFLEGMGWKAGDADADTVDFVLEVDADDATAPQSGVAGGPGADD
ncbi:MAG: GNAT family N-acetyltransferase, partial [Phycisphaerales bacterium]